MTETRKAIHYDGSECYMPANRRCKNIRPEPEPRTDQTARGEEGGEWECWTCEPLPDGTSTYPVQASPTCRASVHDIRRVEGKLRD